MKLFLFILAVISFGLLNSTAVLADEGTICNEMKLRLKAIKAMQAQQFYYYPVCRDWCLA